MALGFCIGAKGSLGNKNVSFFFCFLATGLHFFYMLILGAKLIRVEITPLPWICLRTLEKIKNNPQKVP